VGGGFDCSGVRLGASVHTLTSNLKTMMQNSIQTSDQQMLQVSSFNFAQWQTPSSHFNFAQWQTPSSHFNFAKWQTPSSPFDCAQWQLANGMVQPNFQVEPVKSSLKPKQSSPNRHRVVKPFSSSGISNASEVSSHSPPAAVASASSLPPRVTGIATAIEKIPVTLANTLLDFAARNGDVAAIDRCIKQGADLNHKTALSKQTPVHASIQLNQFSATQLLVTRGADIYQRDANGRNCIEQAIFLGKHDIANVIQKLSIHRYAASIIALNRFSAINYAHSKTQYKVRNLAFSMSAMENVKGSGSKRVVALRTRRNSLARAAVAAVLVFKLSYESGSRTAQARFHAHLHTYLMLQHSRCDGAIHAANHQTAVNCV
jgi:hypothetical protein